MRNVFASVKRKVEAKIKHLSKLSPLPKAGIYGISIVVILLGIGLVGLLVSPSTISKVQHELTNTPSDVPTNSPTTDINLPTTAPISGQPTSTDEPTATPTPH